MLNLCWFDNNNAYKVSKIYKNLWFCACLFDCVCIIGGGQWVDIHKFVSAQICIELIHGEISRKYSQFSNIKQWQTLWHIQNLLTFDYSLICLSQRKEAILFQNNLSAVYVNNVAQTHLAYLLLHQKLCNSNSKLYLCIFAHLLISTWKLWS